MARGDRVGLRAGDKFGNLTVIEKRESTCLVRCTCGNTVERETWNMLQGRTKHCGCVKQLRQRLARERNSIDAETENAERGGKTCTLCGQFKTFEEFPVHLQGMNGRHPRCYECKRVEEQRDRRERGVRPQSEQKLNELGQIYARVTVIADLPSNKGSRMVLGRCECGSEQPFGVSNLKRGIATQCRECGNKARKESNKARWR